MGDVARTGKAVARRGRVQGDRVAFPVALLVVAALAAAVTTRSRRRRSDAGMSAGPAGDQRALDETSTKLRLVTEQLTETRAGLAEAQAEVLRLSEAVKATSDRAEAEMGRMESAAITALETAAAANREEVAELRRRLSDSDDAARAVQTELDVERRRAQRIQAALAGRDTELANLRASARGGGQHL